MSANDSAAEKSIVTELNFGAKTSKRVSWESAIESLHLVRITNASDGAEKADHSSPVGVKAHSGVLVPADKYNKEYACKHKVALATAGGSVVLKASANYSTLSVDIEHRGCRTSSEQTRGIGGQSKRLDAVVPEECAKLSDLPCWPCYRDGLKHVDDSEASDEWN